MDSIHGTVFKEDEEKKNEGKNMEGDSTAKRYIEANCEGGQRLAGTVVPGIHRTVFKGNEDMRMEGAGTAKGNMELNCEGEQKSPGSVEPRRPDTGFRENKPISGECYSFPVQVNFLYLCNSVFWSTIE